tara:strand:- start:433 stop:606 length:174 start_codon:yes stop_codon:yes gene_type:complete
MLNVVMFIRAAASQVLDASSQFFGMQILRGFKLKFQFSARRKFGLSSKTCALAFNDK